MDLRYVTWMQPRNPAAAIRSLAILAAVAVGVTVATAPIHPGTRTPTSSELIACVVVAVVAVVAVLAARPHPRAMRYVWALGPPLAVAAIVAVDYLTEDGSVAAQVFFFFPTLYGASQLRPRGAAVMTAVSVAGVLAVTFGLLPLREAVVSSGYVAAALITTAMLLSRAAERQAELVAKLERQAAIDPLTGLVTRRVLDDAAQSAMSGAASGAGTSLIVLDVDTFKQINDSYGHPAGDEVLIQLAELLVNTSRAGDVVSRLGGDEIALLLPGCSEAALRRRADQIVWDVRARTFELSDGTHLNVSVSVGMAHAPSQAVDLRTLYSAADAALYQAKRSGRNRVGVIEADAT